MHISAPVVGEQLQNDEFGELNWPKTPVCRFTTNGGLHVLRKKGVVVGGESPHIAVKLKCKCWHCPECRVKKAKAWRTRLGANLTTALAEGRVPFILSVEKGQWRTVSKRFARADARWCAVETDHGRFVIGAALPGRLPKDATEVDAELAFALLDKYAVEVANRTYRKAEQGQPNQPNQPITACRGWKAEKAEGQYSMVGRSPTRDPVELRSLLGSNNIPAQTVKTPDGWVIRFRATPEALSQALFKHEVKERRSPGTSPPNSGQSGWNCLTSTSSGAKTGADVPGSSQPTFPVPGPTRSPSPLTTSFGHPTGSGLPKVIRRRQ